MSNDFVAQAKHVCPVCGKVHTHDTEILIHKKLRTIPEDLGPTATSLCQEDAELFQNGYVALVAIANPPLGESGAKIKNTDAERTGDVVHIPYDIAEQLFESTMDRTIPIAFVPQSVVDMLRVRKQQLQDEENSGVLDA